MKDIDLIKPTPADSLLQRIEADKAERNRLAEEAARRNHRNFLRGNLLKTLVSVYRFLIHMGLKPGEISLEEFEAAEEKLKELAKEKIKGWSFWTSDYKKIKVWKYYLEYGFFPDSKISPFDNLVIYWHDLSKHFHSPAPENYMKSDDDRKWVDTPPNDFLPNNAKELYDALWKKRFPEYQS